MKKFARFFPVVLAVALIASMLPASVGAAGPRHGTQKAARKAACETSSTVSYPVVKIAPVSLNASATGTFKVCIRLAPDATSTVTTSSIEITSINGTATQIFALDASNPCTTTAVAKFDRSAIASYLANGKNTFTIAFSTSDGTAYSVTATAKGIVRRQRPHFQNRHRGRGRGRH